MDSLTILHVGYVTSLTLSLAFACGVCGIAQGIAIKAALESMARQPELAGDLRLSMIIGLAMIESLAIYCLLVSLILIFVRW